MALPLPFQRTWETLKVNKEGVLLLGVANLIFTFGTQFAVSFLIIGSMFLLIPLALIFFLLLPWWFVDLEIWLLYVVLAGAAILVLVIVLVLIVVVSAGLTMGWNVYIARWVDGLLKGEKVDLSSFFRELWKEKRHYLKRGLGIAAFNLLVIAPIMVVLLALPYGAFFAFSFMTGIDEWFLFPLISQTFSFVVTLPIAPITSFIMEKGCIDISRGKRSWEGMIGAVGYIFRRPRLFGSYYVGMLCVQISLLILFPVAILIAAVQPVATKMFLIVNEDH